MENERNFRGQTAYSLLQKTQIQIVLIPNKLETEVLHQRACKQKLFICEPKNILKLENGRILLRRKRMFLKKILFSPHSFHLVFFLTHKSAFSTSMLVV